MRTTCRIRAMGKMRAFRVVPFSALKNESLKTEGTSGEMTGFFTSAMMSTSCSGNYTATTRVSIEEKNPFDKEYLSPPGIFRLEPFLPEKDHRAGQINGRIDALDRADQHEEGEVVDDLPAEEEQGADGQEDRPGGDDRPAQALVDGGVHDLLEGL